MTADDDSTAGETDEQPGQSDRAEHLRRLTQGRHAAAEGYDAYFVPRFAPWADLAVQALTPADPHGAIPDGPILVPRCDTSPELELLVARSPDREIVGIDLSAGMVQLARKRAARWPKVTVIEADASTLAPHWTAACSAVLSVFGLQQLPDPDQAIKSWLAALRPGGLLSVVYWPPVTERTGPFALLQKVLPGRSDPANPWDTHLTDSLTSLGATIERDEHPTYPITHPNAATFFDAYSQSGPLRSTAITKGAPYIASIRQTFLTQSPPGEWTHHPHAHLLVARSHPNPHLPPTTPPKGSD